MRILSRLLTALALMSPLSAFAQGPAAGVAGQVAGPLSGGFGGGEFGGIAAAIALSIAPLVSIMALILIVRSGFYLAHSQQEDEVSKARKTITACLIAIVLVNLVGPIRDALYTGIGTGIATSGANSGGIVSREVLGLIAWIETPLAVIAVMMIIVSGIRAVVAYGSDGGITKMRQTVISILAGLVVLSLKFVTAQSVAIAHEPSAFMAGILTLINIILGFTALVATAVVVYAGFQMIYNVGEDEKYTQARKLIIRVGIGLLIIIMSWALANLVIFAV